ncbi:MAG: SLATT domain-containing protein [Bryobacteraceae bacterium]
MLGAKKGHDIERRPFPNISGDPAKLASELEDVFQYVSAAGESTIEWYRARRRPKRLYGWMLRAGAIVATAIAGIIPILSEITTRDGRVGIPAGWSAVALGLAGLFLAFDKFGDYTSGWIRYMMAELEVTRLHNALRFEWQTFKVSCLESGLTPEKTVQALALAKGFIQNVDAVVRDETASWSTAFQAAIKEMDQSSRAAVDVKRVAAVNIRVVNGERSAGGWSLSLNGGLDHAYFGQSASISDLVPGTHTVRVTGQIDNRVVSAEKAFVAAAGAVAEVEITLV